MRRHLDPEQVLKSDPLINSVYFISAQPDDIYFLWQLKIQIYNFVKQGINLENIFCIIGYKGHPRKEFEQFSNQTKANIIFIEDTRENPKYVSSIRPHLLGKFFRNNPELNNKRWFYHDSDIIFRQQPSWQVLNREDVVMSDCSSYLGYNYLRQFPTELLFQAADIAGISIDLLRKNKDKNGGAQYLFNTLPPVEFWDECYEVCEKLFVLLDDTITVGQMWAYETRRPIEEYQKNKIQSWTADMWAILWLMWKYNLTTSISADLNFSWAVNPMYEYDVCNIFHNAGVVSDEKADRNPVSYLFYKGKYTINEPFDEDFTYVDPAYASYKYIELIQEYRDFVSDDSKLLLNAKWAGVNRAIDLTDSLEDKFTDEGFIYRVNTSILKDIDPGFKKKLVINYRDKYKQVLTKEFNENSWAYIPYKNTNRLAIWYSNNRIPVSISKASLNTIKDLPNTSVLISSWDGFDTEIPQVIAQQKGSHHINIILQILQLIKIAKTTDMFKYVTFCEHDVLYNKSHFDFPDFDKGQILVNKNYKGICKSGWQQSSDWSEPLHQMTMHIDDAYEHFIQMLDECIGEDHVIVEPNLTRIKWNSLEPCIHINYGNNFTGHYTTFSEGNMYDENLGYAIEKIKELDINS